MLLFMLIDTIGSSGSQFDFYSYLSNSVLLTRTIGSSGRVSRPSQTQVLCTLYLNYYHLELTINMQYLRIIIQYNYLKRHNIS